VLSASLTYQIQYLLHAPAVFLYQQPDFMNEWKKGFGNWYNPVSRVYQQVIPVQKTRFYINGA
jgi:hypothetical protein